MIAGPVIESDTFLFDMRVMNGHDYIVENFDNETISVLDVLAFEHVIHSANNTLLQDLEAQIASITDDGHGGTAIHFTDSGQAQGATIALPNIPFPNSTPTPGLDDIIHNLLIKTGEIPTSGG